MDYLSHKHFEILKGIAIIAVLICHIGGYSGKTWFTPLGGIGVALFLFCSGYGLYCSYKNSGLKNYWGKKICGVYSTYFLIEIIAALFFTRQIKTVVLDLLLIKPSYAYGWYMQYLFGCYFVFWLVFKFFKKENIRLFLLVVLAVSSFFVFDSLRGEQALSFVGGILTAALANKNKSHFKHGKLLAFFLLFFSILLLAIKQLPIIRQQHTYVLTLLDLFIKSFAAYSIVYLTYAIKFISKIGMSFFGFMGKISYSLYLIHGYSIYIISQNLLANYFVNSLVFVVISVVLAYVMEFFAKKIKWVLYKAFQINKV